ncbi:methyltransferase domain-containing protein [Calothrix sp. NIES-2100]|uniref:methyltransferase domain-containing protein n=1 Tax=Calothrix sp. NIES-2100 TaxID=1954172 RepID=UPI000BBBD786
MERVLEPEVMDTIEESVAYDAMDFSEVNTAFVKEAIALCPQEQATILDAGTGPGHIPILICQIKPQWQVTAIDLAATMLEIAAQHVQKAGLQAQINLELVNAKKLPYQDEQFDMVISNSLIHHLPDPLPFFLELKRVVKPHGGIFIRDLFRPADEATINDLVNSIGVEFNAIQTKCFRDSLYAAFTLDEVTELFSQAGLSDVKIYQNSNRHWTAERVWSE